jgi:hypothetical protein
MRSYFDVNDLDSDQTSRERIAGKLLLLDERFAEDLPLIFDFLAVPDPERPPPRMDPEARQRLVLGLTKRLIQAQGAREPGVTVFEDLHWLTPQRGVYRQPRRGLPGRGWPSSTPAQAQAPWMSKCTTVRSSPASAPRRSRRCRDLLGAGPSLEACRICASTAGNASSSRR